MQKNDHKQLKDLIDKTMQNTSLETPSLNFTHQVMHKLNGLEASKITTYKPLISKMGWAGIIVGIIGIFLFLVLGNTTENSSLYEALVLRLSTENLFSGFAFSGSLKYAIILFAIMLFIQVPILKHYFNGRLEMD